MGRNFHAAGPVLGHRGVINKRAALFRLRVPQMLSVLFWRLLIGGAGFAKRDRHRLLAVLDLLSARSGTKLAMLELVHDAFDGFLLRFGFARRHFSSPFDGPRPYLTWI